MKWWLRKQWLRIKVYASENYYNEAESLIIWYAVSFALGAAFYFAFPWELPVWLVITYLEGVLLLLYLTRRKDIQFKSLTYVAVFMLGLCVAKADAMYRKRFLEQDMPEISYMRAKIKNIDYGTSSRPRLTLTNVNNFEKDLKGDFRISLNYMPQGISIGNCVELVAKIPQKYTPNPMSNYNFERDIFYKGLSATGYAISPIFNIDCPTQSSTFADKLAQIREYIKKSIDKYSPKDSGSIIKAITIGEYSSISQELSNNYRTSGLAHFLSISGMHMGMIALLVFFLIRTTLFPLGAGRYDLRKPAAVASIIFTLIYFLISGQSVSCIRAFVMTNLVLLGVLINRRAISLRLWAFAVIVVIAVTPVAVISPGFLMSFGAVLGLVSFYEKNAIKISNWFQSHTLIGKLATYIVGLLLADLVASLMTLPYSLYYFKQISVYTSLGNLLAGPIIAFWIMPCILLYLISLPFGFDKYSLIPLNSGVDILNNITAWVTSLPGATSGNSLRSMPEWGIFILTIGLLWVCIWQAKWRKIGTIFILVGLLSVFSIPKADFIFDKDGTTYAYRDTSGVFRSSKWHKNNFLEKMWTGSNIKGKFKPDNEVPCDKNSCTYQKRIRFGKGFVEFDGKDIPLKDGGYISLKSGVQYTIPEKYRLWNK